MGREERVGYLVGWLFGRLICRGFVRVEKVR